MRQRAWLANNKTLVLTIPENERVCRDISRGDYVEFEILSVKKADSIKTKQRNRKEKNETKEEDQIKNKQRVSVRR